MPVFESGEPSAFRYGTQAARKTTLRQVRKFFGSSKPGASEIKKLKQAENALMLSG
jgi:hypothetical protein